MYVAAFSGDVLIAADLDLVCIRGVGCQWCARIDHADGQWRVVRVRRARAVELNSTSLGIVNAAISHEFGAYYGGGLGHYVQPAAGALIQRLVGLHL